jgi:NTP pyrophosphatase (non-canonical NTP hydrolase)
MRTEDIDGHRPSKWIPMTDLQALAALGKLAEECGELSAIIARCIIHGIEEKDPETGEVNAIALKKEIADVQGLSKLVVRHFGMDPAAIAERAEKKYRMKVEWLEMLR